ncbi:MAG: T9SS type A sorting domain-containing protein, partial [Candidatus Latescibacteria bacterium]|nr:T9SS type A sorting domain-containing protein [Candidatus Latescibacterota bacterium]
MYPGNIIDLLTEVDLTSRQWQRLTIPLEKFGADERLDLTGLGFTGNLEGTFYLSDVRVMRQVLPAPTAVVEEQGDRRPRGFALQQNYPNPFNSGTVIRFDLPEDTAVELAVYDLAGQRSATLVRGWREAGSPQKTGWKGDTAPGPALISAAPAAAG